MGNSVKKIALLNLDMSSQVLWSWFDEKKRNLRRNKEKVLVDFKNLESERLGCEPVSKTFVTEHSQVIMPNHLVMLNSGVASRV